MERHELNTKDGIKSFKEAKAFADMLGSLVFHTEETANSAVILLSGIEALALKAQKEVHEIFSLLEMTYYTGKIAMRKTNEEENK